MLHVSLMLVGPTSCCDDLLLSKPHCIEKASKAVGFQVIKVKYQSTYRVNLAVDKFYYSNG